MKTEEEAMQGEEEVTTEVMVAEEAVMGVATTAEVAM